MFLAIRAVAILRVTAFALVVVISSFSSTQENKLAKEIQAIYAKRNQSIKEKDFASLKADEAEDYTEKSKDGTVRNRKQADAEADELFALVREVYDCSTKIDSIKEDKQKNEVTVEVSESAKLSFVSTDGIIHEMSGHGRSRDIWRRTQQAWKIKFHEELESTIEVRD